MKLRYVIAKAEKTPTNLWILPISWMSGDADHYEKIEHKFKSEEAFIKAYEFMRRFENFSNKYHNTKCDLLSGRFNKNNRFYPPPPQIIAAVDELLEGETCLQDVLDKYGIEPEYDIISESRIASPELDQKSYYYNEHGVKFDIEIE